MTRVFGLLSALPPSLRGVVLDIEWDRERLWALDLPTVVLPVAELRWHLALPLWRDDEGPFRVTPKEVLAEPLKHADQFERVWAADLAHPLHVLAHEDGLTILDGVHRLLKADMLQWRTVRVKVLAQAELHRIAVPL